MLQSFPPRSPFSTPLSGSAREAEGRIRNLFQYQKRRPPVWLLLLAVLVVLTCGGLVSCRTEREGNQRFQMVLQYYDVNQNYIEIPRLLALEGEEPDEAMTDLNQELEELADYYRSVLELGGESLESAWCLLYPTETERYVNLVLFQKDEFSYINSGDGNVQTWCYDKGDGSLVTLREALELAGLSEDLLFSGLEQFVRSQPGQEGLSCTTELRGFRIREDGGVVFYLTADLGTNDPYVGPMQLYLWEDGTLRRYDAMTSGEETVPLVPAEECADLEPPLWRQWYFAGGEPEGGFAQLDQDRPEEVLARTALEDYLWMTGEPQLTVLLDYPLGNQSLIVVRVEGYPHAAGLDNLVWGVWDDSTRSVAGEAYFLRGDQSAISYWTEGEELHLLLTNCTVYQGYGTGGGLAYFRFGPQGLEPVSQLPRSARSTGVEVPEDAVFLNTDQGGTGADAAGASEYWYDHQVLPTVHGAELFVRTPGWEETYMRTGGLPQWTYMGYLPFDEVAGERYGPALEFLRGYLEEQAHGGPSEPNPGSAEVQITGVSGPYGNVCTDHPGAQAWLFDVIQAGGEAAQIWVVLQEDSLQPAAIHEADSSMLTREG